MQSSRIHFAAMALFVLGFVLSSSGWAPILSMGLHDRPSYSVCGQEMCSCLPTTPTEPECPLCITKEDNTTGCSSETESTPNPKRLPRTDEFDAISDATQAGCSCVFLTLVLGYRVNRDWSQESAARISFDQDRIPPDPLRDAPTPPPRS
ncbi:MAG: hypothetical protein ACF8K1_13285 [Phycisphaerales bacterium JB047]